jgi:hypothetical protein
MHFILDECVRHAARILPTLSHRRRRQRRAVQMIKIFNIYYNKKLLLLKCWIVVLSQVHQNRCLGIQ